MASAGHALGALRIAAFALEQAMDSLGPEHGLADQLVDTLRDLGRYQRELSLEDPDSAPRVDRIEFISPKSVITIASPSVMPRHNKDKHVRR